MRPRVLLDLQDWFDSAFNAVGAEADLNSWPSAGTDGGNLSSEISAISAVPGHDVAPAGGQNSFDGDMAPAQQANVPDWMFDEVLDATAPGDSPGIPAATVRPTPTASMDAPAVWANPASGPIGTHIAEASASFGGGAPAFADFQIFHAGPNAAAYAGSGEFAAAAVSVHSVASEAPAATLAYLENPAEGSSGAITDAAVGSGGATAAQVQQALDESGLSVNGTGIKVGVLSDSFNDLGGAAADEADGALPSAGNIDVIKDLASGGTDEGRAMMQIIHDIAPGASLAFYTAFDSEQDFANGILALAAAGCKVIVDDVSYSDEPFFQNGVVAQAIQTVEAEGVTYVTAAGNDASNGYQSAWTPISGTYDGRTLTDAESFGGSLVQTVSINTEGTGYDVPLLLEWNQAYGAATSDLKILVFNSSGQLVGTATNASSGEPTNPWVEYDFTRTGTYYVAIENLSGPNPGLIKEITEGDGLPATISAANAGTVFGHAMMPGAITAGAVSAADTPAFGVNSAVSESFSSSGAGTELLFANNGTLLSSPQGLSPVAVSGVDDIATTVSGGLSDFYGTSAASASLAGVAALILSADPNLSPAQVEAIMEQTALPMSNSAVSGAGLVQVDAAVTDATPHVIQTDTNSFGSTSLVELFNDYYLQSATIPGTGVELKFGGAPVTAGEFAPYTLVGAAQTSTGYDVAWEIPGTEQFSIWTTDSSGNFTSYTVLSGSSTALESLENTFHQDLNGDGVIGIPAATVIQTDANSFGSTSLTEVASNYYLYNSGGTGPELKFGGAPVTAGEFAPYTLVGAAQTSTGYDVAWQIPGTEQFSIWNTDSSGNYTSYAVYSGSSPVLQSLESSFHQDLNGDGVIGLPAGTTVTESFGSSSLVKVGSNYYLESNSSGAGPELSFGGAAVTAGQFGSYTPVGTEQTSGGYEVAWQIPGTQQFSIWNTDSSGNFQSYTALSGTSAALESLETSFHQDLNGDGVIGVPAAAASQAAPVSVANNDTFLFRPGFGADVIVNAGSAETIELDGFSSVTNNAQLATLLNEAQTGQSQSLFLSTNGGHDTVVDLGNHDSITLTNVQIANLHANNFIVL